MLNRVQSSLSKWYSKASGILKQSEPEQNQDSSSLFTKWKSYIGAETDKGEQNNSTQKQASSHQGEKQDSDDNQHLAIARESLHFLLKDQRVPEAIRHSLQEDYVQVEQMLDKLEHEHIHIAVLGRVSVGKSSLLNALLGGQRFSVSPLHGETKQADFAGWNEYQSGNVILIDTPGINEVDGKTREKMALEVVSRADIILYVVDGDMTDTEFQALKSVSRGLQPVVLVLNKADRYNKKEQQLLLDTLSKRCETYLSPENILPAVSQERVKTYIMVDEQGNEEEIDKTLPADINALKERLWQILEKEGKTLAALNAALFAGELSEQVSLRLVETQKQAAEKMIRTYCIGKGVAVAVNPIPVADLMAAAMIDLGMIMHLSKVYGLPLSKSEAGHLVKTIMAQIVLLMGSIWAMNLMSSVLKLSSGGLSTFLTASAQGAVAYYGTYVVGRAAELYFKQGKSWGELGPKRAVQKILESLDRDSIIEQAKGDIMARIKTA